MAVPVPATGEDITLATRWILEGMEKHQDERRGWRESDLATNAEANKRHDGNLRRLVAVALLRPLIELAILIVLLVKL